MPQIDVAVGTPPAGTAGGVRAEDVVTGSQMVVSHGFDRLCELPDGTNVCTETNLSLRKRNTYSHRRHFFFDNEIIVHPLPL